MKKIFLKNSKILNQFDQIFAMILLYNSALYQQFFKVFINCIFLFKKLKLGQRDLTFSRIFCKKMACPPQHKKVLFWKSMLLHKRFWKKLFIIIIICNKKHSEDGYVSRKKYCPELIDVKC